MDDTADVTSDATGEASNHTITTSVTVTVPAGKAYNCIVIHDGGIMYSSGQRSSGATAFYGAWRLIYHATWPVRLTAGSHTPGINIFGYSDNTMNVFQFNYNHLQILMVF